jgi:glutamate dehydrogenase (NAD(P)+)
MWDRYRHHLEAPPFLTVEWSDPESEARGWLVINSLRGGAAGGGTRMRPDLQREEVVYLAKAMEMKFAFSGPPIGGAKSGIAFDPADPRREGVLRRWFRAIHPYLATCYGTAGDVAVDEERDVVPLCLELGLAHPQEGVVRGHMGASDTDLDRAVERVRRGVAALVEDDELGIPGEDLTVSDLITGWGVVCAAGRCLELAGESLDGKRVIVEGFGNVGASAALHAARRGARIVGIVDARHGLVAPDGLGAEEVEDLLLRRTGRILPEHPLRRSGQDREAAYGVPADLFIPAAISGSLTSERLDSLSGGGVRTLVCGANQPFAESRLGDTAVQEAADRRFAVVPDIIGGLGMACAFHHFMTADGESDRQSGPEAVFEAVRTVAEEAVERVHHAAGGPRGMLEAAVGIALER